MEFYKEQHKYCCGVDLHARSLYICIIDQKGDKLFHRQVSAKRDSFLKVI